MGDGSIRRSGGPADIENMYTAPLVLHPDASAPHGPAGRPGTRSTSGPIAPQMAAGDPSARVPFNLILPARPTTVAESGLELVLLEELTLRHIVASGTITGADLAKKMHLSLAGIVEEAVNALRRDGLVDYQSGGANNAVLGLAAMRLRATERGTQADRLARERNGYVGPAPVSLGAYERMLRQQAMSGRSAPRADVYHAVGHLVLGNDTIDRLGAGLESGGPILLHGPAGNGKTTIAASIARMFAGAVLVPHAVVIGGHIMRVLDPSIHRPTSLDPSAAGKLDDRWVYCQVPFVRASNELEMHQFELHFNRERLYYDCPLQLKAAGGVLLLDDLEARGGTSEDVLLRCIEPLAKGIDYLTTVDGQQIAFPFTALVTCATSKAPAEVLTERLLRQIPCKIAVADPSREQFAELLRRACQAAGVEYTHAGFDYLIDRCYTRRGRALRACHPAQLVRLTVGAARYFETAAQLVPQLIDVAADLYFS